MVRCTMEESCIDTSLLCRMQQQLETSISLDMVNGALASRHSKVCPYAGKASGCLVVEEKVGCEVRGNDSLNGA